MKNLFYTMPESIKTLLQTNNSEETNKVFARLALWKYSEEDTKTPFCKSLNQECFQIFRKEILYDNKNALA